jgi:hypothetical protein
MVFYKYHIDTFNLIFPDFTPRIIFKSNVRISLVCPGEGNNTVSSYEQKLIITLFVVLLINHLSVSFHSNTYPSLLTNLYKCMFFL